MKIIFLEHFLNYNNKTIKITYLVNRRGNPKVAKRVSHIIICIHNANNDNERSIKKTESYAEHLNSEQDDISHKRF